MYDIPSVYSTGEKGITVEAELGGYRRKLLVDTGAQISILKEAIPGHPVQETRVRANGVTGQDLKILGE